MSKINLIKNIAIILDFIISIIASTIKNYNEEISNILFGISAIVLIIAVVCIFIEEIINWKIKKSF